MNRVEEKVVAVIEPQAAIGEDELSVEVSDIELRAEKLAVTNDDEYREAGDFGRLLKCKMDEVTSFFAPMKKAAHEAHKQVCDREKQMLAPLKNAETAVKKSMGDYALLKERKRREAEEEVRRLAQEEADKKLAEAIQAEERGDNLSAQSSMIDAEIADNAARMSTVDREELSVKGVSAQKDWEITNIELDKVPNTIMGIIIRPVDKAAVLKLIRASKGTIQIEGITYQEKVKMSFRR